MIDDFVYEQLPQRIVFGWGRLRDLPAESERLAARRLLLISERSTKPVAERIESELGDRIAVTMSEVNPHVPRADVDDALARVAKTKVDAVITIGGGSATGLGKAIVLEIEAPLIAVPTTYAGSEVTPIYGITEGGHKRTGRDGRVLPKTVLYDPELTTALPAGVTASSGMNAIAHCVEALYAENATPLTSALAVEAIRLLPNALAMSVEDPAGKEGRSRALYGAYLAGMVLASTGMAIHHRICHVLGGTFGLPHGDANAVVLPHAIEFNEPAAREAIKQVAEALEVDSAAPALFDLAVSLEAPTSLQQLGMARPDIERAGALVIEGSFYNPRPAKLDDVIQILDAAYDGRRPDSAPSSKGMEQ